MLLGDLRFEGPCSISACIQIDLAFAGFNRLAGLTVLAIRSDIIGEVAISLSLQGFIKIKLVCHSPFSIMLQVKELTHNF